MRKAVLMLIVSALAGCNLLVGNSAPVDDESAVVGEVEPTLVVGLEVPEGARVFVIDPAQSTVEWEAEKVIQKHNGTLLISEGAIYEDSEGVVGGEVVVDMSSLNDNSQSGAMKDRFEGHVMSGDFFDVAQFPTAKLVIVDAVLNSSSEAERVYEVTGELTIRGVTNVVEFVAIVGLADEKIDVTAEFEIDRTLWEINFGSGKFFDNLGDNLIDDIVKLNVHVVAEAGL